MLILQVQYLTAIDCRRSIHNVRIERLWVDVWKDASKKFSRIFLKMARKGYLKQNDRLHLAVLYIVYMPRIQAACDRFVQYWNEHGVRTARYQRPSAMWELSKYKAEREGWWDQDPGDRADIVAQADYGIDVDDFSQADEENADETVNMVAAEGVGRDGVGKGVCTEGEIAAATDLLTGFAWEEDLDEYRVRQFRAAVAYAQQALRQL